MVIGVTGGFACGKSTVSKMFRNLGAKLIDADRIAHNVLQTPIVKKHLVRRFRKDILDLKNDIDRKKLSKIVFSKRSDLNFINRVIHPEVVKRIKSLIKLSGEKICVLDIPLLFEAKLAYLVDYIVVVKCLKCSQIKRAENNNFDIERVKKIIQAQMPLKYKVKQADYVVDNSYSLKKTNMEVKRIWQDMVQKQNKK